MNRRARWAFGQKKAANMFTYEHGWRVATFEEAMKATYEDMCADTKMIRDRRKIKENEDDGGEKIDLMGIHRGREVPRPGKGLQVAAPFLFARPVEARRQSTRSWSPLLQVPQYIRKAIADLEGPIPQELEVFDHKAISLPPHHDCIFPSYDIPRGLRIEASKSDRHPIPLIPSLRRPHLESSWPLEKAGEEVAFDQRRLIVRVSLPVFSLIGPGLLE